jgi:tetratricopeptide (TPR) repeat protein/tRNA A-37 threonylcarbamoyl transferase component Bud32
MSAEHHQRVMAIFEQACEAAPEARSALVRDLCAGDEALRRDVEALLAADDADGDFLDDEDGGAARVLARDLLLSAFERSPSAERPGEVPARIGEYEIVRRLGFGGMGTVYEAQQAVPRRRVAIKTIHPWVISERSLAHFRFEADALANLEHPNIPRVFSVEEHDGAICIVMELVRGPELRDHVASSRLEEKLELLARVADAVHHAHLRGFVHRDLKPDNVRIDEDGSPRVLDFGIAQVLDPAAQTPSDRLVSGTLPYMSPEQLRGEPVDGRADVYALGVMLFELVSGRRPHEVEGLSTREASERVHAGAPRLGDLASVDREIACIAERALAVEPDHRYPSAEALADDLRRYLAGDVVKAHPQTRAYLTRKTARKYWRPLVAITAIVVALAGGGIVSFASYLRAESERARAEAAAVRSKATVDFLQELLTEAHPTRSVGEVVTIREAVDRAAARVEQGALSDQPEVKGAVRLALAETYRGLSDIPEAFRQIRAVLELGDAAASVEAEAYVTLASLHRVEGDLEAASDAIGQAVAAATRDGKDLVLIDALWTESHIVRELGDIDHAMRNLERVIPLGARAVEKGDFPPELYAGMYNSRGYIHAMRGELEAAERDYRTALALDEAEFGPDHPEVAVDIHNLAWLANNRGRHEEALELLDRAHAIRIETLGPDHFAIAVEHTLRASILVRMGRYDEAEPIIEKGLAIIAEDYGEDSAYVIRNQEAPVKIRLARGEVDAAIEHAQGTLADHDRLYGPDHWTSASARLLLARALAARGDTEEARRVALKGRRIYAEVFGATGLVARQIDAFLASLSSTGAGAQLASPP